MEIMKMHKTQAVFWQWMTGAIKSLMCNIKKREKRFSVLAWVLLWMKSTFTKIKRLSEEEMSDFSDSVKFDPNYKLNYVIYIMDLRLQGKKCATMGINLWETEKKCFETIWGKAWEGFFCYASRASSVCKSRYWSCTGTMGLPSL